MTCVIPYLLLFRNQGRVPYDVAKDKATRNAFRRFMATHPDKWDYLEAKVNTAGTFSS